MRFQLQSLFVRAELGLTEAAARDVYRLREQRAAVGDEDFLRILQTALDANTAGAIMQLTAEAG